MIYTLHIYKRDKRHKNLRRHCGTYKFDRPNWDAMNRELKELTASLYRPEDGYTFLIEDYEDTNS